MKIFSMIMAIYMLVLFLIPCNDTYEKDEQTNPNIALSDSHSDTQEQHKEHSDNCSPFCLCGCSGVVIKVINPWNFNSFSFHSKSFELAKTETTYRFQYIPSYIAEIWQPPQLNV